MPNEIIKKEDFIFYQDDWVTLYCGNNSKILPLIEHVDIVITDPPWDLRETEYELEISHPHVGPIRQKSKALIKGVVGLPNMEIIRSLQDKATHDCLILSGYRELADVCKTANPLRGVFVWHKPNGCPSVFYPTRLDASFIVWTGKKSYLYGHQRWPSMIFSHSFPQAGCFRSERICDSTGKAIHPCQGPISLYKDLMHPFPQNITMLDPYAGTGTSLLAAKQLNYKAIGIEIDECYCEIAAKRMAQGVFNFNQ